MVKSSRKAATTSAMAATRTPPKTTTPARRAVSPRRSQLGSPGKKRAIMPTPNEYMLNAKAKSKAKLPICAMRKNPNLFFQKPTIQATRRKQKRVSGGHRWAGPAHGQVSAGKRRPGLGRQGRIKWPLLCALLVVALANFALRSEPVFGFVTGLESPPLGEQVGELADFVLQADGNEIGSGFGLYDFRLACGLAGCRRRCGLVLSCGGFRFNARLHRGCSRCGRTAAAGHWRRAV